MIDILCVTTKLCFGGVQTFLINNVEPLLRRGYRFNFAVQTVESQPFDNYVTSLGCKIFRVTPLSESKIKFVRDIKKIIRENPGIKIIHSHQNFANAYSLIATHSLPVRVSHSHNFYKDSSIFNTIMKKAFRFALPYIATEYWACSDQAANWLYGNYAKSSRCHVIKNAISSQRFAFNEDTRQKVRNRLNLQDKFVWCHIGSFGPAKNHAFLLQLFKKYNEEHEINHHLLLCGDGALRSQIEAQINVLGLNEHVTLLGNVKNTEDYLCASDLFVMPSLFEGFPLVVIEAQCSGIPCVTSEAIPQSALLTPNIIRVPEYSYKAYAGAIDSIVHKNTRREDAASIIRDSGFDIESEADKIADLYSKALSR